MRVVVGVDHLGHHLNGMIHASDVRRISGGDRADTRRHRARHVRCRHRDAVHRIHRMAEIARPVVHHPGGAGRGGRHDRHNAPFGRQSFAQRHAIDKRADRVGGLEIFVLAGLEHAAGCCGRVDELVGHDPVLARRGAGHRAGDGNPGLAGEYAPTIHEVGARGHEGGELGHQIGGRAIAAQAVQRHDEAASRFHAIISSIASDRKTGASPRRRRASVGVVAGTAARRLRV